MPFSRLFAATCAVVALVAHAQTPLPPGSGASGQKLRYESAFIDYRPYTEAELLSWNKANHEVTAPAGRMGHAMRDAVPATTQKSKSSRAASPTNPPPAPMAPGGPRR